MMSYTVLAEMPWKVNLGRASFSVNGQKGGSWDVKGRRGKPWLKASCFPFLVAVPPTETKYLLKELATSKGSFEYCRLELPCELRQQGTILRSNAFVDKLLIISSWTCFASVALRLDFTSCFRILHISQSVRFIVIPVGLQQSSHFNISSLLSALITCDFYHLALNNFIGRCWWRISTKSFRWRHAHWWGPKCWRCPNGSPRRLSRRPQS